MFAKRYNSNSRNVKKVSHCRFTIKFY